MVDIRIRWRAIPLILGILALPISCFTSANAQTAFGGPVETAAAENSFTIEPSFSGAHVVLFGALDREKIKNEAFDLAITIHGPNHPVTIWKKELTGALWINAKSRTFEAVPSFYAVLSSKALDGILSFTERDKYRIGIDTLKKNMPQIDEAGIIRDTHVFEDAIIRLKTKNGLFVENDSGVEFLGRNLFRAGTTLPASARTGLYVARTFVIQNGKVTGSTVSYVNLKKVGIESLVSSASADAPWLYGLVAVGVAAAVGSGASALFRPR